MYLGESDVHICKLLMFSNVNLWMLNSYFTSKYIIYECKLQ